MNSWYFIFMPNFLALVRCFLAVIFLTSSIQKIREPKAFEKTVLDYRLLPTFAVHPFAFLLPWSELVLGLLLILGWQVRLAAAFAGLLLFVFTIALLINLLRGRKDLNCGCFGPKDSHRISIRLIIRDLSLVVISVFVMYSGGGNFSIERWASIVPWNEVNFLTTNWVPFFFITTGLFLSFFVFLQAFRLIKLLNKEY